MLEFRRVTFAYGPGKPVLRDFSLRVHPGEFWAIVGPSGSGKTTLLHLAAGLLTPASGQVQLDGLPLAAPSPRTGLMLQDYGLLPWFRAGRNLEVGLAIAGVPRAERAARARHWLERLGLPDAWGKFPFELSGGQRQRVALARLLALDPEVLLLDEPLSAVDELTRERLQLELHGLVREGARSTLLVTHNIEEAALLADHVLLVTDHAPITAGEVLESPFGNDLPQRSDPAFQAFCAELRARLGQ